MAQGDRTDYGRSLPWPIEQVDGMLGEAVSKGSIGQLQRMAQEISREGHFLPRWKSE